MLRTAIRTTDGNVTVHLRKLDDAGSVSVQTRFLARKQLTRHALSAPL